MVSYLQLWTPSAACATAPVNVPTHIYCTRYVNIYFGGHFWKNCLFDDKDLFSTKGVIP